MSSERGAALSRVARAWRRLAPEGRMAAGAALLLFVTMFLPWYQLNAVVADDAGGRLLGDNLTAFGVFSFVEAAVLLVALAVLVLLFARAEGRSFHLPGGDGAIVTVAGGWVALLLVWRLFDKPDVDGSGVGNVGIQWGIFFALGAAGLLALAGTRMRHAERVGAGADAPRRRRPRGDERPRRPVDVAPPPGTERTRPLPAEWDAPPRERPWEEPTRAQPAAPRAAARGGDLPEPDGPPEAPPALRRRRAPLAADAPTERLPEPPTERLADPPTERLPERGRDRERPAPQSERLWDDG